MQLVLMVAGKVLDRVYLTPEESKSKSCLQAQKRLLLTKHELSIIALGAEPVFYLEAASKINN